MATKKATTKKTVKDEPRSPRFRESEAGQGREVKKTTKKKVEVKVQESTVTTLPQVVEEAPKNNGSTKLTTGEKYFEAVGRRKESIARVRLFTKKATDTADEETALITVNGKSYHDYFSDSSLWNIIELPLRKLKSVNRFKVTVVVHGGGKSGQADAIKHGIARTLVEFDSNFRKKLKKAGYLKRDPREKERRKYGLKKARKAPRWAKR